MTMDRIIIWNVMGINNQQKQQDVKKQILAFNKVGLVGLLETKVNPQNMGVRYQIVFEGWCFSLNSTYHLGGRVVIAWNPGSFSMNILFCSSQIIHCYVVRTGSGVDFFW